MSSGVCKKRTTCCAWNETCGAFSEDLVGRSLTPTAPNALRVADITQHPTWQD